MKDFVLDHVAVAVSDLNVAIEAWEKIGLRFDEAREVVAEQKVEVAFAQMDQNARLELLCPINEESAIYKFIENKGPGIHHLCFKVKDIDAKCRELNNLGIKLIYSNPVLGAHNCRVNFIHPKSTGGVLVEISQPAH